ncbi:reverse transcriptase family protein [Rhizophagus irregularis DAOM 181602=DAOM 197198]|nr:reverse transcriptase family protein [Rhizophagus irregularis DAOM 181602=DAOM 197198]
MDIEDFETDHKALTIKMKIKEPLERNRLDHIRKIRKESRHIKFEQDDWNIITEKVEQKLENLDGNMIKQINREQIWDKIVEIIGKEKKTRLAEIKTIRNERKNNKTIPEEERTNEEKLENLIDEYETMEKIDNIEHGIRKIVDKVITSLWRNRTSEQYEYTFKEFNKYIEIEEWGTSDTGKFNAIKIRNLIKIHDRIEIRSKYSITIDKLRKYDFRKELIERTKTRKDIMRKTYEKIMNLKIEVNIRKRELYLEEDIGKMINRILEKKRGKINMSSLIIKEKDKITIEKDQEVIKEIVTNHYKGWTRKREIDLDEIDFNHEWREIYSPKEDVNEEIYKNLMDPIEMDELDLVLSNLKTNKAPGQSGIPYDFWKKSKILTRKILLEIINESMSKENVLDEWKKGIIYPINKTTRSNWNQELSLTRPIVLLETARKIWFKILVNRLNEILTKEQILTNTNFAALKNESMLEPIKIIQAIIEDANNYKKEAWILLMDISKAYDSVNTTMLKKSLERIKLPKSFINLVMDISLNRSNKILVNNELTESYQVEDGIDQGEVWSPILWRIFYDALLCRLNEIKEETGYSLHEEKIFDKGNNKKELLEISINVTAFMDDTTLISQNK